MADITIERRLPVINGFVEIPDGKGLRVTPAEALELIPGSTLIRLGVGSSVSEIQVIEEGEEAPTPFKNDHAFSFNGVDNYAQTDSVVSGIPGTGGYSISFWIKSPNFDALGYQKIFRFSNGTAWNSHHTGLSIETSQGHATQHYNHLGRLRFQEDFSGNVPYPAFITSDKLINNTWNHVLVTSTSTALIAGTNMIYLNGALTASGVGSKITDANMITVAASQGGGSNLHASLDEMAIWDIALTSDQITDIYSAGKIANLSSLDTSSNLKIWWRFGDGSGDNPANVVYDQMGLADLTCYNMDSSNKVDSVPVSPGAISAYAVSNTARQHQGDLFIKLPAYNSTASTVVDTFEQLRTRESPTPTIIEEEEAVLTNTYCFDFDGVDDYGQTTGLIPSGIPGPGGYSISFWIKSPDFEMLNYNSIFRFSNGTAWNSHHTGLSIETSQGHATQHYNHLGRLRFQEDFSGNVPYPAFITSSKLVDNTWNHVLVTSTSTLGGDLTIYLNGLLDISEPKGAVVTGADMITAAVSQSGWNNLHASLDEVAIWDTALTPSQVADVWAEGKTIDLSNLNETKNNLVSWWRMGDASGDSNSLIKDIVGSNDMPMTPQVQSPHGIIIDGPPGI